MEWFGATREGEHGESSLLSSEVAEVGEVGEKQESHAEALRSIILISSSDLSEKPLPKCAAWMHSSLRRASQVSCSLVR
jgi:hypothetical protein